jgi:SH3-like domain-containing protein
MRAEAENSAAVLTVVPAGKNVQVVECRGWCEVSYEGRQGFIHQRFLKE